jgi:hypothetical protein
MADFSPSIPVRPLTCEGLLPIGVAETAAAIDEYRCGLLELSVKFFWAVTEKLYFVPLASPVTVKEGVVTTFSPPLYATL